MWSAAVLLPAFPGRSRTASGSPVPSWPWSANAQSGWWEAALERRPGVLLVAVRGHQRRVDVHHQRAFGAHLVVRGVRPGELPDRRPSGRPGAVDRRQGSGCVRSEGVDRARDGRVGGNRPVDTGLGPEHGDVGQAVPAQRERDGQVQQHLGRVVHRSRRPPRFECAAEPPVQAAHPSGLQQGHPAGLRDDATRRRVDLDSRIQPGTLLHLEGAPR